MKNIRDKDYIFGITVVVCAGCGEEMSIPGLPDKNVKEIDEQYRAALASPAYLRQKILYFIQGVYSALYGIN